MKNFNFIFCKIAQLFLLSDSLVGENLGELRENKKHKNRANRGCLKVRFRKKIKSACCMVEIIWHYFLELLLVHISNRLLQTKLSNIISLGYTIFWNGTKFMWTLPFLHAVSFLPLLLSTASTQGGQEMFSCMIGPFPNTIRM